MTYKSAAAVEMAVKSASSASSLDTGRAVSSFYFHRLLCRVFAGNNKKFVLKGGQAMLARTIDARATRDIDLLALQDSLENALTELVRLAESDLGDFVVFEFAGSKHIKAEDEYRSGLSVKFTPRIGVKRMQQISIDLVVDKVPLEEVEVIEPVDRIQIEGLLTCNYLLYPVENALADKFCALIETHDGRVSTRVKDLVDIAVYAVTCTVDGDKFQNCLSREVAVRGMEMPDKFSVPREWGLSQGRQFEKLSANTGLPAGLKVMDVAAELAGNLIDPAISASVSGLQWFPEDLKWECKDS